MLAKLGYQVVTADSGEQAIDIVKDPDVNIDLVILDLIMPGIDGGKAFEMIHQLQPGLPVILSSGYSRSGRIKEIMRRGCRAFIQKPFDYTQLSSVLRKVLDEDLS